MKIYSPIILLSVIVLIDAIEQVSWDFRNSNQDSEVYRVSRGVHGKKKDGDCHYKKGPWSQCDSSNIQKKTLNLKRGDSSFCEQTKEIARKCKKACKYIKGDWSDCDVSANTRERTDTLKPKSDSSCQPTRTLSKKCKKVCKFQKSGIWSECDATTGVKTKTLVLKSGNPQVCEATKKITKPCNKVHVARKTKKVKPDDYDEDE